MLEATVKELASHTKEQIDGLRNDMAAEFVKRDDDIVKARTEGILAHNALAADLAKLAKRVDWLEAKAELFDKGLEVCVDAHKESLKDAEGVFQNQVAIADVVRGLMRYLGTDIGKLERCIKEAKAAYEKMIFEMPQSRSKDINQSKEKYEAPKVEKIEATKPEAEPALEAEETLFSELEKKKRNKRLVAPHPGMKQLRSWALHYGMTQREFSWGMSRLGYPIRKSEGARNRDIGSCWLSPDEAKRIYVEIIDHR